MQQINTREIWYLYYIDKYTRLNIINEIPEREKKCGSHKIVHGNIINMLKTCVRTRTLSYL